MNQPDLAQRPLPMILRGLFLVGFTLSFIAGIQLFILSASTDVYFAWTIQPPLTAAFMGAFFWASSLLFLLSAGAKTWAGTRGALLTIFPFTALLLIATLLHVDRFHLDSPDLLTRFVTWVWFAVYILLPPVSLALLLYQSRMHFPTTPSRTPALPVSKFLLGVQAALELVVGAALFLVPGTIDSFWPWDLTPLTSQAIGSWLLVTGFTLAIILWRQDLIRLDLGAIGYTAIGVLQLIALARFADEVHWDRIGAWAYLLAILSVLVLGAYLWYKNRPSTLLELTSGAAAATR